MSRLQNAHKQTMLRDKYAPTLSVVHYLRTDGIRDATLTGAGNAFANTSRSFKSQLPILEI
jgi:hypothetical protein